MASKFLKKAGFAFAFGILHCVAFAQGSAVPTGSSAQNKIRVGVAIIEPRFSRDVAVPDVLVIGPLPINIDRPSRPEIRAINLASEIERATCSSVEQHLEQLSCAPFPAKAALAANGERDDSFEVSLGALAKYNATLPPERKVDTFLVLEGTQINDRQFDKWGTFGVVLMQTANFLFQNTGYVPASFIAMRWRFYDATTMEQLTTFATHSFPQYNRDVKISKDELPSYLGKLSADPQIEASIRRSIASACFLAGKQLDLGLWNRFKDADPWTYIRKHGY